MSVTNHQDFKSSLFSVELKKISDHGRYDAFKELLATANYMLPSNSILIKHALSLSLLMHPIVVIQSKKSKDHFLCIGGIRSLKLAKASLTLDEKILVTLLECPRHEEIEMVINADILLSPLLMSVRSPITIGAIHQKMSKKEIDALLIKGMHQKLKLAEKMDFAKNTVFPPKKNTSDDPGNAS